jgi:hypothetical protein
MFSYHVGVTATHPYSSRWYQWLLNIRPILYYLDYLPDGRKVSIAAFLNPMLCWGGLLSLFVAGYLAFASVWLAMSAAETLLKTDFSGLPFLYMLADVLIVLTYDQVHSHDLSALAAGRNAGGARGCVLMGLNGKYLGSDEKSLDFFPELRQQRRDTFFPKDSVLGSRFARLIRNYTENIVSTGSFRSGDRIAPAQD